MTIPDKPNSRLQRYRLTAFGQKALIGIELELTGGEVEKKAPAKKVARKKKA